MDYNRIRAANDRLMGHKRVTPLLPRPSLMTLRESGFL